MYEALLAEIAALNTATIKIMSFIADHSDERDEFFRLALEDGKADLKSTMYGSIPADRYGAFLDKAQARYAAILNSAAKKM